ncbi:hypothetical protein SprV_0301114200 [Sparganum proliferum]
MPALSTSIPRSDRPCRTPLDQMRQQPTTPTAGFSTATAPIPMVSTTMTTLATGHPNPGAPPPSIPAIVIILAKTYAAITTTPLIPATGQNTPDAPSTAALTITTPTSNDVDAA